MNLRREPYHHLPPAAGDWLIGLMRELEHE